ncbi:hypothetical protein DQ04_01071090 [Trypanosoma grayi]|uniref:hypothetical protein n=1 Tax=Trypanosoma grayi TaxID=71804 RepID=UPI0004F4B62B|nr:hypothetical protein DQ04_01071090 [Trypanosoma grayi]KEG13328.1 hypothetical protein DQ04_01071090 [Trypanosoma grayi]
MTCVTFDFDSRTVVYGGWSPAELHQLAADTDVLAPSQPAVTVAESIAARLRPSMLLAPFEALRCFWDPAPQTTPSSAEVMLSGSTCCMQVSWNGHTSRRSVTGDIVSEHGAWLRFVSTFPHKKYAFQRSPRQLSILINALRASFPHLLVPASRDASIHLARSMLDFVETHAEAVCAYLPLLYFLYESDEKSVVNFFNLVEELARRRQLSECGFLDSLKPRESSWFSWVTAKPRKQEVGLTEDVSFIDANADRLPHGFKERFLFAQSRREALGRARNATVALRDALLEDVDAFEATVEFCGRSRGRLLQYGCESWGNDTSEQEEHEQQQQQRQLTNEIAEKHGLKEAIAEFMAVASVLQGQIFGPILNTLVDSVKTAEVTAETQHEYLRSVVDCAKIVVHNEPLITGARNLHKTSQAANNRALLRQASECYGKMRQTLRAFKLHLDPELSISDKAMQKFLVVCCTQCYHAFTTFYDAFDARHHVKLLPTGERRNCSIHPLLRLFDCVGEHDTVRCSDT